MDDSVGTATANVTDLQVESQNHDCNVPDSPASNVVESGVSTIGHTTVETTIQYVTVSADAGEENGDADTFHCDPSDPSLIYDASGQPVNMEDLDPPEKAVIQAVQQHLADQQHKTETIVLQRQEDESEDVNVTLDSESSEGLVTGGNHDDVDVSFAGDLAPSSSEGLVTGGNHDDVDVSFSGDLAPSKDFAGTSVSLDPIETTPLRAMSQTDREDLIASAMLEIGFNTQSDNGNIQEEESPNGMTVHYWIAPEASTRGRDMLFDSLGHLYTLKSVNRGSVTWRCKLRTKKLSCKARIKQEGSKFSVEGEEHNHDIAGNKIIIAPVQKVHSVQWDYTPVDKKRKRKLRDEYEQPNTKLLEEAENSTSGVDDLDALLKIAFDCAVPHAMPDRPRPVTTVVVVETPEPPRSKRKRTVPRKVPRTTFKYESIDKDYFMEDMDALFDIDSDLQDTDEMISPEFTDRQQHQNNNAEQESKDPEESKQPEVTYRIIQAGSARRGDKLFDSLGYSYTVKRLNTDSKTWRCTMRNKKVACAATVKQWGKCLIRSAVEHNHDPRSGDEINTVLVQRLKDMAQLHLDTPTSEIAREQIQQIFSPDTPSDAIPRMNNLQRKANHLRRKIRGKNPTSTDFKLERALLPIRFLRDDVKVGEARHLIFATDAQLELMTQSKLWYVDSALCLENKPFYRLLTVHIFARKGETVEQIPVLFVLMSSKTPDDYDAVLESVKSCIIGRIKLKKVVLQYESAVWDAFSSVFPLVKRTGCPCHFQQCLYEKLQDLGLKDEYEKQQGSTMFVKQLMMLSMVPYQFIGALFTPLEQKASSKKLKDLCTSFRKMWLETSAWTLKNISGYDLPVRTKVETVEWNSHLNRMGWGGSSLYWMVRQLYNEFSQKCVQCLAISEEDLKIYQKKQGDAVHKKIFKLWKSYQNGAKSPKGLLKSLIHCSIY